MKKEILKIAGVKSEKEFYKKFPTEKSFLDKHGKAFRKAQGGVRLLQNTGIQPFETYSPPGNYNYPGFISYDRNTGMINSTSGQVTMADTQRLGFSDSGKKSFDRWMKDLNKEDLSAGVQATSTIGSNVTKIQRAIEEKEKAKQLNALAPVIAKATGTVSERIKNKYPSPEDYLINPNQLSPSYGTGYTPLQMQLGGEIQNTYAPNTLYDDLGYEPLDESSVVKQYEKGGNVPKAEGGSTFGDTVGLIKEGINTIGDVVALAIDSRTKKLNKQNQRILGQAAFQSGMQDLRQGPMGAFMEDGGGLKYLSNDWQPQLITKFGDYDLKDLLAPPKDADMLRAGGHLKEYTAPSAAAMSTERPMQMGGDLTIDGRGDIEFMGYNPEAAKTGASGYIGITRGPSHDNGGFNVDYGGNTVEVEGNETVIEKKEGGTIDGGKSLVILGDMYTGAFGKEVLEGVNERLAKKVLKGKNIKDVKFKHLGNQVAKLTGRLNKAEDKFIDLANSADDNKLKLSTAQAGIKGIRMQYKELNKLQQNAIDVQSAAHSVAEKYGYDDTPKFLSDLKKGKVKDSSMAKYGKTLKAQSGTTLYDYLQSQGMDPSFGAGRKKLAEEAGIKNYRGTADQNMELLDYLQNRGKKTPITYTPAPTADADISASFVAQNPEEDPGYTAPSNPFAPMDTWKSLTPISKPTKKEDSKDKKSSSNTLQDLYSALYPYIRPLPRNPLDPVQLAPEMLSLALNTLEPVPAQTFAPMLETPYRVSLQDQLNEIQADVNASKKLVGNNPEALAALDANAAKLKSNILGQQLRINMASEIEAYNRNREAMNRARLTNIEILGQQADKQAMARSKTRAQAIEALSSVADKIAKNKAETLAASVMTNMYPQFAFGPKGRIFTTGLANFNIPQGLASQTPTDAMGNVLLPITNKKGEITGYKVKDTARNGSIVKALKNL